MRLYVRARSQNALFRRVRFSSPGQTRRRLTQKRTLPRRPHAKAHSAPTPSRKSALCADGSGKGAFWTGDVTENRTLCRRLTKKRTLGRAPRSRLTEKPHSAFYACYVPLPIGCPISRWGSGTTAKLWLVRYVAIRLHACLTCSNCETLQLARSVWMREAVMAAFDEAILEENRRRIIRYFESGARELHGSRDPWHRG